MSVLKDLREKAGLSQKELAKLCNMTQVSIAQIETGARNVTIKTARIFGKVLHVPPYVFLPEDFQPEPLSEEERAFINQLRKYKAEAVAPAAPAKPDKAG